MLLSGCVGATSSPTLRTVCPVNKAYSPAFLLRAETEYRTLPANSALKEMVGDFQNLRDQVRACRT